MLVQQLISPPSTSLCSPVRMETVSVPPPLKATEKATFRAEEGCSLMTSHYTFSGLLKVFQTSNGDVSLPFGTDSAPSCLVRL